MESKDYFCFAICDSLKKCWLKKSKIFFLVCFIRFKKSNSLIPSFFVSDVSDVSESLTKNERCERIAQVANKK